MFRYRLAANFVLIVHAAFIAFVISALLVTILGWWFNWRWVRNRWFRGVHLLCIAYVVFEAWFAIECPLTTWENHYRVLAGQEPYDPDGCIAHWLQRFIFFHASTWVFTICYTLFGLLVVAMMLLAPPSWRKKSKSHVKNCMVFPDPSIGKRAIREEACDV